jgi:hypothetical protein
LFCAALVVGLSARFVSPAAGDSDLSTDSTSAAAGPGYGDGFTVEKLLPRSIAQNLDVNLWGWFSWLHDSDSDESTYWNGDVAIGVTQRLGDRVAISADMHFIDDNNYMKGFLEQAFVTAQPWSSQPTLLTVGKFNADFGIEPRDEWNRLTGTTGLLFGAQPQDLLGIMLTQPIGQSSVTIKPFLSSNFEGKSEFSGPPGGGVTVLYEPRETLSLKLTNWIGPGARAAGDDSADDDDEYGEYGEYGYGYSSSEYSNENYSSEDYDVDNWQGPSLNAVSGGFLYFADANVRWMPRPDLTLAAEGLIALNGRAANELAWGGFMLLANYDITDVWRVFGRWSFLDDPQGIVTGVQGRSQELSGGVGYTVISGLEIRGEYRHDFMPQGSLDSVSVHWVFSY